MSTLEIQRAIRAVHEWTALKLAVENEWGGGDTRDKALALLQRVLDGLSGAAPVYRDELEPVLEAALLDEFNVEAEDESPRQVAELLCKMHAEALAGGTATAAAVLERAAARGATTWVDAALPRPPRGADDSSDDDDDDGEDATTTARRWTPAGGGPSGEAGRALPPAGRRRRLPDGDAVRGRAEDRVRIREPRAIVNCSASPMSTRRAPSFERDEARPSGSSATRAQQVVREGAQDCAVVDVEELPTSR